MQERRLHEKIVKHAFPETRHSTAKTLPSMIRGRRPVT